MKNNHIRLLVHTCNIERPVVQKSIATIRDRQVAYDTKYSDVKCWFEPTSTTYEFHDQLGQQAVNNFNVHFLGGTDVVAGDRLKKGTTYYLVKGVQDNTDQGFHVVCQAEQRTYAMV